MAKLNVYFGATQGLLSVRPMVDHINGVREHMSTSFVVPFSGSSVYRHAVSRDMIDASHLILKLWAFQHLVMPDEPVSS